MLFSCYVLEDVDHLLQNELNGQGFRLQYCLIGGHLNFFLGGNEKMQKNEFFHKTLISQNLLKEANIQARSM